LGIKSVSVILATMRILIDKGIVTDQEYGKYIESAKLSLEKDVAEKKAEQEENLKKLFPELSDFFNVLRKDDI